MHCQGISQSITDSFAAGVDVFCSPCFFSLLFLDQLVIVCRVRTLRYWWSLCSIVVKAGL